MDYSLDMQSNNIYSNIPYENISNNNIPVPSNLQIPTQHQHAFVDNNQNQEVIEQQTEIVPKMDDPFSIDRYNDVQLPDAPVQYGGSMASELLNDMEVPKSIRDRFWFIFHKDNTLTFLDEARKTSKLLNFDIMKIDYLNSIPYYDYTFAKELEFGVLRNVFETKLDRALGLKGPVKNERIILQSQFSENRNIQEAGTGSDIRSGFFKRLLGRR